MKGEEMSEENNKNPDEKIRSVTIQLNSLFETISKTKYRLLEGREELKVAEMELKLMENKMKFMRETEIPSGIPICCIIWWSLFYQWLINGLNYV